MEDSRVIFDIGSGGRRVTKVHMVHASHGVFADFPTLQWFMNFKDLSGNMFLESSSQVFPRENKMFVVGYWHLCQPHQTPRRLHSPATEMPHSGISPLRSQDCESRLPSVTLHGIVLGRCGSKIFSCWEWWSSMFEILQCDNYSSVTVEQFMWRDSRTTSGV